MPQAIQDVSTASGAGTTPPGSSSRSRASDKPSFRDALGEASSADDSKTKVTDKASQPVKSEAKKPAPSEKSQDKKAAKSDAPAADGKKKIDPVKPDAKGAAKQDPPADEHQKPDSKREKRASKDLIGSKAAPASAPTMSPAAIVQLGSAAQQAAPAAPEDAGAGKQVQSAKGKATPAGQRNDAGPKSTAKVVPVEGIPAVTPVAAADDGNTQQSPDQPPNNASSKPRAGGQVKTSAGSVGEQPNGATASDATAGAALAGAASAPDIAALPPDPSAGDAAAPVSRASARPVDAAILNSLAASDSSQTNGPVAAHQGVIGASKLPPPTEAQFAEINHSKIVSEIQGRLLPNGGSMHIRLDPPELGAIHVHVEVRDGIMNASFETDNDQTVQLLSHSLGSLKTALEAQGMTIEKLHVHQSPRQQQAAGERRQGDSDHAQDHAARQEQQRKEVMRRMWRKLMKGPDPLDLVA